MVILHLLFKAPILDILGSQIFFRLYQYCCDRYSCIKVFVHIVK